MQFQAGVGHQGGVHHAIAERSEASGAACTSHQACSSGEAQRECSGVHVTIAERSEASGAARASISLSAGEASNREDPPGLPVFVQHCKQFATTPADQQQRRVHAAETHRRRREAAAGRRRGRGLDFELTLNDRRATGPTARKRRAAAG